MPLCIDDDLTADNTDVSFEEIPTGDVDVFTKLKRDAGVVIIDAGSRVMIVLIWLLVICHHAHRLSSRCVVILVPSLV